jgi:hypothetical protein
MSMPLKRWYLSLVALSLAATHPISAQSPAGQSAQMTETAPTPPESESPKQSRKAKNSWRVSPALRVDAEYDDNVFLLSSGRKDDVENPSSAEMISGRYADMEKGSDLLTTMSAGLVLKGPGLWGKPSVIAPEVSYELYTQNDHRSNVNAGFSVQQQAWAGGRLRLQGRVSPKYFVRNYLVDAIDRDGSGSITEDERMYAPGEYAEGEFGADYRLPLSKVTKRQRFGAAIQLGGGFSSRSYAAPFAGRNLHGPTAGAKLLLDLGRRLELDVGYDYTSLAAPRSAQVLLLNEADFDQDFNGNGTATDLDARVATLVDRSRKEHRAGATLHFEPSKPVDVTLGYEYRWRRYTSDQPLDVSHRGRKDARHQISSDIRFRLGKDLRLRLGGVHSRQNLNRTGDPGAAGEIDDYTRSQARLGLSYQM